MHGQVAEISEVGSAALLRSLRLQLRLRLWMVVVVLSIIDGAGEVEACAAETTTTLVSALQARSWL
jgi:hypothetical protein